MRSLRRALLAFFILALMVLVLFFFLENQQAVSLILFGWTSPSVPVALLILIALFVGLLVGPVLSAIVRLRNRAPGRDSLR
ncbi:lipopolysaccharide assembly protein LapA domain-containing protein [Pseudomonas soli]|uniref:DUF1049 domain-containing protein n=1 Tax=Pseudomonas soli TaxID=1306993 RepID=A0A2V4IF30_9PSED|nr:LapA family protein [Pseudomonas soli]PYB85404.1 DUF1049 domain-containing protein [Pseudomonas soli]